MHSSFTAFSYIQSQLASQPNPTQDIRLTNSFDANSLSVTEKVLFVLERNTYSCKKVGMIKIATN